MASNLAWGKEAILRQLGEGQEKNYLQSYIDYMNPRPGEIPFIESYIASIEQDSGQTGKERQQLDKGLENAIVALFAVVSVVVIAVVVVAQIALLFASLVAVVIGAFAVSGMFKGGGSNE